MSKKIEPTPIQKSIIREPGNVVVSASAGTGKTFTLVQKISYEDKLYVGHKTIAAITFTIKAANEIKDRLIVSDKSDYFIGTNNSFAIEEIIKPFIRDVFGSDFNIPIETDYNQKFNTKEEGLRLYKKGIIGSYNESKSNFVFELALYIIKKSKACSLYIKAKYRKIYIDEYQDSDKDMHAFFMYLVDMLGVEAFIVGDDKQSIYLWRNADPEAFLSITKKSNYKYIPLLENHRSCKQIQNYSNLLFEQTKHLYEPVQGLSDIIFLSNANWSVNVLKYLDKNKSLAILRYKRNDALHNANELTSQGIETTFIPILPISNITAEYSWFIEELCKFCIVEPNIYNVINSCPYDFPSKKIKELKTQFSELKGSINDEDKFKKIASEIALNYFNYKIRETHVNSLWASINDETYKSAFMPEKYSYVAMTFHSSKGLEFDQVIIFTEDYPLNNKDSFFNHYVSVTRAKEKLFIIHNQGNGRSNLYLKNIIETIKPNALEDLIICG